MLNVAADSNDAALQRSAAEIFAFAACIGSTPFAAALVRTLVQALADSPSAPRHVLTFPAYCCHPACLKRTSIQFQNPPVTPLTMP